MYANLCYANPRKRAGQFPEAAPFIRNRDNPVYGFVPPSDTKLDLKAELPSSLPVVRTKPIPEWKVEVKPKTSQVSVVLTDLKDSCLARNSSTFLKTLSRINSVYIHRLSQFEAINVVETDSCLARNSSTFLKMLSRINSVYIHRLSQFEAINVVETVFSLIQELKDEPTFCQELIQLIRQLFLKYDIPGDLARTIYFDIRKKKDAIGLGSLLSLLETFICNGKIDAEDCADLITVAKLKLLNGTENSRLFVAKFLIACLKNTKSEALKIDLRSFLMPYCDDRCSKIRRIVIEGIEKFF
uniref:Integrase catalytic domain-containing protein n=1 Tax=Panagrolaimus sp. JU765 TaxID=591449 RepID=A0AC34PYJ1_9BILA